MTLWIVEFRYRSSVGTVGGGHFGPWKTREDAIKWAINHSQYFAEPPATCTWNVTSLRLSIGLATDAAVDLAAIAPRMEGGPPPQFVERAATAAKCMLEEEAVRESKFWAALRPA